MAAENAGVENDVGAGVDVADGRDATFQVCEEWNVAVAVDCPCLRSSSSPLRRPRYIACGALAATADAARAGDVGCDPGSAFGKVIDCLGSDAGGVHADAKRKRRLAAPVVGGVSGHNVVGVQRDRPSSLKRLCSPLR